MLPNSEFEVQTSIMPDSESKVKSSCCQSHSESEVQSSCCQTVNARYKPHVAKQ